MQTGHSSAKRGTTDAILPTRNSTGTNAMKWCGPVAASHQSALVAAAVVAIAAPKRGPLAMLHVLNIGLAMQTPVRTVLLVTIGETLQTGQTLIIAAVRLGLKARIARRILTIVTLIRVKTAGLAQTV